MTDSTALIDGKYTYFAFICYTHADFDEAQWLYKKLQSYGLPTKLVKRGKPKKLSPVFLDHVGLLSNDYEEEDISALQRSKFLVVVCSKNLAKHDKNVNDEIIAFTQSGHTYDQIIPYIVDACEKPEEECFPSEIKRINKENNINLIGHNIYNPSGKLDRRQALIKTIAKMHDIDAFELDSEDFKRLLRKVVARITAAVLCVFLAFGVYTYISYNTFPCQLYMQERLEGAKVWYTESVEATVGDVIEFQIEMVNSRGFISSFLNKFAENNNLEVVSDDVMLRAVLPTNMEYINGSTVLYNSNHQSGITLSENSIVTNGINIGDAFINANSYVRFKCIIKDVDLPQGNTQAVTWGTATIWPPNEANPKEEDAIHVKDDISVNIIKP